MKKEIRDRNKVIRDRIRTLEETITKLRRDNEGLIRQGQTLQQKVAQNNTEIIKTQGGIEELRKQLA